MRADCYYSVVEKASVLIRLVLDFILPDRPSLYYLDHGG